MLRSAVSLLGILALLCAIRPRSAHCENWSQVVSTLERSTASSDRRQLAVAYNNYAIELANQGHWSEAEAKLKRAVAVDSRNSQFRKNLAAIYLNHATALTKDRRTASYSSYRHRDAKRMAEMSLQYDRSLAAAHLLIGDIEYANQRLVQAKTAWSKAQKLDASLPGIADRMQKLSQEYVVEKEFDRSGNGFFDLRYQDTIKRSTAFDLTKTLNDARRDVGRDLNYLPRHKIVVLIYSQQGFAKVRRGPDWASGIYDGKIRVPFPSNPVAQQHVKATLYHEYTHAVVHDLTGNRCPVWLNEGLAEYEEAKIRSTSLGRLRTAARIKRLVPLAQLNAGFKSSDAETATLAYEQSYSIVRFLVKKYGFYRVRRMLEHLGAGDDFESALHQETRLSLTQLERNWKLWLPTLIR